MTNWATWVGRTATSTAFLDPEQASRMAVTLDRPPTFAAGDALPPAWHWLYFHDFVEASRLGVDGHPALGVTMPPVPFERRMWAAGSLIFGESLKLGETATRTSTITSIVPKEGRTGSLYFVTVEHNVHVNGISGIRDTQTFVYRHLAADTEVQPPVAPTDQDLRRQWSIGSIALFRYSALTFNGHRIHYDVDYARDVEGYPGLVIHGPMLATLLMELANDVGGELATFSYQARSALCVPEEFTVNIRSDRAGSTLWAAGTDGRLAMDANATFRETTR